MVSGASQIDGRSPLVDQLTSPANFGAWGAVIVGNFVFPLSHGTPELPQGIPSHRLLLGGCPSMGNPPPSYFPFQVPIPATSLLYPLYVCTYL